MAYVRFPQDIVANESDVFEIAHAPGEFNPDSGIYRRLGWGSKVVSEFGKTLPPQDRHQPIPKSTTSAGPLRTPRAARRSFGRRQLREVPMSLRSRFPWADRFPPASSRRSDDDLLPSQGTSHRPGGVVGPLLAVALVLIAALVIAGWFLIGPPSAHGLVGP